MKCQYLKQNFATRLKDILRSIHLRFQMLELFKVFAKDKLSTLVKAIVEYHDFGYKLRKRKCFVY